MSLPYDWSRCKGLDCSIRKQCARFLDQPENTLLSWVDRCFDPDTQDSQDCHYFIFHNTASHGKRRYTRSDPLPADQD